jgi:hypothetical protein
MADQPDLFGGATVGVRELLQANAHQFRRGFPAWLEENGHVWRRFAQVADEVRRRRAHYSARTIVEVLRHESALSDTGDPWKLNNNHAPDLARLYLLTHPDAVDFFETRVPEASERTA